MKPRPYQSDAERAVNDAWQRVDSVVVELPTGTGKTVLFSELAAKFPAGRVLIVVPSIPLISQAADKLERRTGIKPDIEQAENRSNEALWGRNKFIVASKQTLLSKRGDALRGERIQGVGLVIFDECHLGVDGIRKLMEIYKGAKFLGVTATPRRHDKIGLHNIFEECAYALAPPSVHRAGRYSWVDGHQFRGQDFLPSFNLEWLPPPRPGGGSSREVSDGAKYISRIQAIAGQGGHAATYRAACRLRDSGMSEASALAAMIEWNSTNATPPWSTGELLRKVKGRTDEAMRTDGDSPNTGRGGKVRLSRQGGRTRKGTPIRGAFQHRNDWFPTPAIRPKHIVRP